MKKFKTILISSLLILSIALSLGGCTFIRQQVNLNNLPDSTTASHKVTLNTYLDSQVNNVKERKLLSMVDAVAMVERSSVAIMTESGAGSGVIIDVDVEGSNAQTDVYIITCHHVISDRGVVNVFIPDENFSYDNDDYIFGGMIGYASSENPNITKPLYIPDSSIEMDYAVSLVGGDAQSDIAVLKLDLSKKALSGNKLTKNDLCFAMFAPQDYSPKRGETVFAVGNPSGILPGTVSAGVISYLEREANVGEVGTMTLMQIDVPTNPGSSGGGLYNLYGELIGITNSGNTEYNSLNFAIPASVKPDADGINNGFESIASQLIASCSDQTYGYVTGRKEKIGFAVTKGETDSGKEYVYIYSVTSGSVASKLQGVNVDPNYPLDKVRGLRANDVVVSVTVNGTEKQINTYKDFTGIMGKLKIGDSVKLVVSRIVNNVFSANYAFSYTINQFVFCGAK